jgi:hypothetical protein
MLLGRFDIRGCVRETVVMPGSSMPSLFSWPRSFGIYSLCENLVYKGNLFSGNFIATGEFEVKLHLQFFPAILVLNML